CYQFWRWWNLVQPGPVRFFSLQHAPAGSAAPSACAAKKGCAPLMRHRSPTLPPDTDTSYGSGRPPASAAARRRLVQLTENEAHYNKVYTAGLPNCAMPCEGLFFSEKDRDRQFASVWIGMWSILCARFNYPERPIVMLSACYVMVSAGYIVRLAVGPQTIACDGRVLRYGSSGPWLCTVVFPADLPVRHGQLCVVGSCCAWPGSWRPAQVFHCIAWVLPIVKFILVLTFSLVDGDPISGICSVGNTNLTAMRLFVLLPLVTYLLIGSVFLLTGFVALFRIRSVIKQQASAKTYKLEKLMIRIGIFSILYTLPASVVIACHFYESQMRQGLPLPGEKPAAEPEYGVFMLRQFMQLAVGITSGVWVWSGKTLHTWRQFLGRLFCCTGRGGGGGGGGGGAAYSRPSAGGHHFVLGGGAAATGAGGGVGCCCQPDWGPARRTTSSARPRGSRRCRCCRSRLATRCLTTM
uniref:G_PROTEIN_RECEP_F2_4 domain-containing protein n=1 Tax=Macrostomum lignano TaxID=282301 RepID=A0A1I8F2G6_9PLAT